jgi:hypothetical protein
MTDDRSLERVARAWLEIGPTTAPDRAVDAALLRIQSTHQDRDLRIPWRLPDMITPARLATVAVIGALAIGAALLSLGVYGLPQTVGPEPSNSPSPSHSSPVPSAAPAVVLPSTVASDAASASALPSFSRTFTSPRMGFSVKYPDRWSAHPATEPWVFGETISWGGGSNDDLHGADVRLSVASQPLKAGDTASKRLQRMVAASPPCAPDVPAPKTVTVGGQKGTVAVNGCVNLGAGGMIPGGRAYVVVLVVGGRAYDFILDGAVDPAYLEAILATVTFDPASARD